jgi:hypothetical protein
MAFRPFYGELHCKKRERGFSLEAFISLRLLSRNDRLLLVVWSEGKKDRTVPGLFRSATYYYRPVFLSLAPVYPENRVISNECERPLSF